ncbi:hypothetical protein C7C46_13050 [Streptomyces tateyamensis]|uniref:DUF2867 domain-containing protein n=1 Tax=Streptomyces tateyamensis TaxID=565073 RepID=A0A2V4NUP9_9ACTN|nr:DUF2867 domain-containing protein [Streptomyces tateyamensis]AXG25739.1 hypothetical protein [Streptomyces tateyamensis]PYC80211.1 hypothetical protein C7C46_13050 [Streptomyces tateyamensis]
MRFRECAVPEGTRLAAFQLDAPHLAAAAVEADLPGTVPITAPQLARAAMARPNLVPERLQAFGDALTAIQGVIFKPFGVVPNTHRRNKELPELVVGDRFGPWQVYSIEDHEVVLGDTDPFWDFRVSFLVTEPVARLGVVLRARNKPGELYYRLMRRMQQRMLRDSLQRGLETLTAAAGAAAPPVQPRGAR